MFYKKAVIENFAILIGKHVRLRLNLKMTTVGISKCSLIPSVNLLNTLLHVLHVRCHNLVKILLCTRVQ